MIYYVDPAFTADLTVRVSGQDTPPRSWAASPGKAPCSATNDR